MFSRNIVAILDTLPIVEEIWYPSPAVAPKSGAVIHSPIAEELPQPVSMVVYPNPADDYIMVELKNSSQETTGNFLLVITDQNGKRIIEQQIPINQTDAIINTRTLLSGQYYCTLYLQGKILQTEVIVKN